MGVAESAVGVQGQGAVGRCADQDGRQGVALGIGVIGQHAGGAADQRGGRATLVDREHGIGHGHGGIVDARDSDRKSCDGDVTIAVSDLVGEDVRQNLPGSQGIDTQVGIVNHIRIGAIAANRHTAI